jgi:DNA replication protein
MVLVQILGAAQVDKEDFLTPQQIGDRCGCSPIEAGEIIERLIGRGLLSIGERLEADGTQTHYFDFKPLWDRLRGRDPLHTPVREWKRDLVSVFESEFGRPLSGMECEQIRNWLDQDRLPEWMILEALKEAVLANKYSFKYIDRVLFDWQRNRIRSRADLEQYRQSYRERALAKDQTAATTRKRTATPSKSRGDAAAADQRYANFYKQFPERT